MFDFHMHSNISFDSEAPVIELARAALAGSLREICFTDHCDHMSNPNGPHHLISEADYSAAYDALELPGLVIHRGIETGLTRWNVEALREILSRRNYDFVIGSVHFVEAAGGYDPYDAEFWEGRTVKESFRLYLEETLRLVRIHDNFDVLGHLTYACKSMHNPTHEPMRYKDFADLADEIMRILVQKGKGMEVNTSGIDRAGVFLPDADYLRRFKELGGEIVTVGSDAHDGSRVGQYANEALALLKDIFGHVCTFSERIPTFHKL